MALVETYRGVVFPWLADQMGHLTTSRYVEMFDVASYHLFHRLNLGHFPQLGVGLADVRHEIDYLAEVPVGGLVLIRSGVVGMKRTSIRARHIMSDVGGDLTHAVLEAVTVRFDLAARKSMPLDPGFAERAAPYLIEDRS